MSVKRVVILHHASETDDELVHEIRHRRYADFAYPTFTPWKLHCVHLNSAWQVPRPGIMHRGALASVWNDPDLVAKVKDIVGLYLAPPEKALVFAVDEKSQFQALDRTQPGLPIKKGRAGTMTHDYKRNGTTTLFAALDMATGKVIGECMPRHRAKEFLAFLKKILRETPAHLDLHLIVDNYATHKTPAVQRWLKRHPRCTLHFTPTSCSWLNMVEWLFAEITRQKIRRGTFDSVPELEAAIVEWINHRNDHPKPFVWTAKANPIIAKHLRARKTLANLEAGCK